MRSRSPGSSRSAWCAATSRVACRMVSASTRASRSCRCCDVVLGVVERLLEHALDLVVGEPVGRLHLDRRSRAGAQVAGRDAQDAVGVDQERHLEPRHARRQRLDGHLEARQAAVVGRQLALALHHVDVDRRLVVDGGGEVLAGGSPGSWCCDRSCGVNTPPMVSMPSDSGMTSSSSMSPPAAGEDVGLDAGAERDDLVGVDVDERRPPEQLLHVARAPAACASTPPTATTSSTSAGVEAGVLERLPARAGRCARPDRATSASNSSRVTIAADRRSRRGVASSSVVCRRVRQRALRALRHGEHLGAHLRVRPRRPSGSSASEQLGEARVEVVAAEPRVAAGRQHLEDAALELQDRDVEGAAAEVVDRDGALGVLVEPVGERRPRSARSRGAAPRARRAGRRPSSPAAGCR